PRTQGAQAAFGDGGSVGGATIPGRGADWRVPAIARHATTAAEAGAEEGFRRVIRLATWNVNSLKARMERVEQWLSEVEPDIVCMQETKLADDAFPALAFASLGYESAHHGNGQWNGVAVLSRVGLDDVVANFAPGIDPDVDARIITATCSGIRVSSVYVPNGRALDHEHYAYKLDWLGRLGSHVTSGSGVGGAVVVAGDFNIAPDDRDVYDPAKFVGATHVSEPERARVRELTELGFVDVFRRQYDQPGVYSWWDYRAGDFHEGRGMRIDLVLATEAVAERVEWCAIDRNARKGKLPSDHAPVIVDLRA
ncbi:MAG: exodeoxyribonuclease III, partial [Ilumatobacteraceae bacterium]